VKKFSINPISFVVWLWLVIMNGFVVALNYFFAILIHELGHYFCAKKFGLKLTKFSICPYGVELAYFDQNLDHNAEARIAFAGPLANFATAFFTLAFWWINPTLYFFTESFVLISFVIGLVNLLPAYPLDGGRIFVCLSSNLFSEKSAKKITFALNLILSIFFFVLFVIFLFVNFNPSFLLFSIFLFSGVLDLKFVSKYEKINVFSKKLNNFSKPSIFVVDGNTSLSQLISHMQTSKMVIFCLIMENGKVINLSEKLVAKLCLNFSYETKLKEIFKNK
jgi:stage IV sporulation protein FB